MKKSFKLAGLLSFGFLLAINSFSCNNSIDSSELIPIMLPEKTNEYGSITINSPAQSSSRSLNVSEIKFARITVSGSDIKKENEPVLDNIDISGGKNSSSITIERIPAGKNRIITVQAFDADKKELPLYQIRAVTDIVSGKNSDVTVSKETTSYGNVIYGLKDFFTDLHNPGKKTKGELDAIKQVVYPLDTELHPSLFAANKLVESYKAFSPLQERSSYILETASYSFNYLLADNFTIHVDDPLSEDVLCTKAGANLKITGIAPGTWNLFIKNAEGEILDKSEITVGSGEQISSGKHLEHNGIAVIVRQSKNYNYIHYWNCSNKDYAKTTWPGTKITKVVSAENAEDSKYYVFDFKDTESVSCLITNSSGNKLHSEDINLSGKGVYCIHSTEVETLTEGSNLPFDFKLSDYPITEENYKTFYYDDENNKRIIMLFNPALWKTSVSSAKVKFYKGINDVSDCNGKSFSLKKDDKTGVYYALVPYNEIRQPNQSGQPTYKMEINDSKFDCVAKLNSNGFSGYVYTKYSSKTAQSSFPCVIFNRQNKALIISRLENEKSYKHVSDFDLSNEEDLMALANFRCVPGTTKLFRSYHPYSPSKTEYSTEPYRMYALAVLGQKYGIKADINVSSDTSFSTSKVTIYDGKSGTKEVSNYQPDYYKSISSDVSNILFIREKNSSFGYDMCYSESDSDAFAKAMGCIIKFVNKKDGPYQLHCAIGTDRTGIACAVLAALCGADYKDLEEDYCASVNMGINEYRGPGCVQYALEQFIGVEDIYDFTTAEIQQKAISHLAGKGGVSESEIKSAVTKLGGKLK